MILRLCARRYSVRLAARLKQKIDTFDRRPLEQPLIIGSLVQVVSDVIVDVSRPSANFAKAHTHVAHVIASVFGALAQCNGSDAFRFRRFVYQIIMQLLGTSQRKRDIKLILNVMSYEL